MFFNNNNNNKQTRSVLERHLVVADRVFTMADLKSMSNDSLILPTVGPHNLQIRVREEDRSEYILAYSQPKVFLLLNSFAQ